MTAKTTYIADGKTLNHTYENYYSDIESTYGARWVFAHRVDLRTELKRLATCEVGPGKPAILIANSKVVDYVRISAFE